MLEQVVLTIQIDNVKFLANAILEQLFDQIRSQITDLEKNSDLRKKLTEWEMIAQSINSQRYLAEITSKVTDIIHDMDDYVEISNVDEVLYFLEIIHEKHVTSFDIEKYPLFAKELRQ